MVMGVDRPGIVERVADIVARHGGNWEDSRMARLAGRFAGVVSLGVPVERQEALRSALLALGAHGLTVFVELATDEDTRPLSEYVPLHMDLVGSDREGILREVTAVLARHAVNVDDLVTRRTEAPMGGGLLFLVEAQLRCPPELSIEGLREALEALSSELAVDIAFTPHGADVAFTPHGGSGATPHGGSGVTPHGGSGALGEPPSA